MTRHVKTVAFAFVAGVNPLVGLWTTVVLGFVAAALGGRAGICSSASGACSVVVAALCASHGPSYLSACAMLAGMMQIGSGILGVGKFVNLVPHPVMLGFVNGLALVMTKAQLVHFKTAGGQFMSLTSPLGASTYGIAALTMALVKLIPKLTKMVPPSLGAVAISSIVAKMLALPAKTLADVAGAETFKGGWSVLPSLGLPQVPFSVDTLQVILPYAITMASVGILESLLTMQILDGLADDGTRGSTTKECIGQGSGNILSGLTGGIGGCALLGQSIINMQSGGGVSRWSGMSMALFLAIGIVAAAPLLANVPVSALVGVMLLVCKSTFSWSSLRLINKIPKLDAVVIALVSIVTVQKDLAIAVVAGIICSALGFAYKQSSALTATYAMDDSNNTKIYKMRGPLFFGSTQQFEQIFSKSAKTDPSTIRLDFSESRVLDHSAVESLHNLSDKYAEMGKIVTLEGLCTDSTKILSKYYNGRKDALPFKLTSEGVQNGEDALTQVLSCREVVTA
jgi:SulP family sulfate permease